MDQYLKEHQQKIIDEFLEYIKSMPCSDIIWCEDGIRRAKEAKTMEELEKLNETIERAWDQID